MTHPHEPHEERQRRDEYPRNVERERHQRPHEDSVRGHRGAAPGETDGDDGSMVRSEPAAARTGDSQPGPLEHGHDDRHEEGRARYGDGHGSADGHAGNGDRLIPVSESEDLRRRWESIQAAFIDSPRESVQEADRLVGELTVRIAERFRSERSGLDVRWERGDDVSTEDLRLTLQRYRGFFDRLLHL